MARPGDVRALHVTARRAAVGLALVAAALAAGCGQPACRPQVEVTGCGMGEHCGPVLGDRTLDWNAEAARQFPQVARLIEQTTAGANATAAWTASEAARFWGFWGVPADQPDKQLFLVHEETTYRVSDRPCA